MFLFIYLFIFLFIFKIIHRHNNLGLTSTWGRLLPFASPSPFYFLVAACSVVLGARGFGGAIRENFFYLLLMNDMHDAIFFFLVYFVRGNCEGWGRSWRIGLLFLGFVRLTLFSPSERAHGVVALPDSNFECALALSSTASWHSLTFVLLVSVARCVHGM